MNPDDEYSVIAVVVSIVGWPLGQRFSLQKNQKRPPEGRPTNAKMELGGELTSAR